MNQFFLKISILLLCFVSFSVFSQENNSQASKSETPNKPLKSMFTLGSGFYSFQGDISNQETSYLSGNIAYNAGMRFFINDNIDFSVLFTTPLDFNEKTTDDLRNRV